MTLLVTTSYTMDANEDGDLKRVLQVIDDASDARPGDVGLGLYWTYPDHTSPGGLYLALAVPVESDTMQAPVLFMGKDAVGGVRDRGTILGASSSAVTFQRGYPLPPPIGVVGTIGVTSAAPLALRFDLAFMYPDETIALYADAHYWRSEDLSPQCN